MCLLNLWSSIFLFIKVLIIIKCVLAQYVYYPRRWAYNWEQDWLWLYAVELGFLFFLHHSLSPLLLGTILFGMLKPLNIVHISIRFYLFYLNLFLSLFFTLLISINLPLGYFRPYSHLKSRKFNWITNIMLRFLYVPFNTFQVTGLYYRPSLKLPPVRRAGIYYFYSDRLSLGCSHQVGPLSLAKNLNHT